MCLDEVLDIPIVVSRGGAELYIEDGHNRTEARRRRGFRKLRVVVI